MDSPKKRPRTTRKSNSSQSALLQFVILALVIGSFGLAWIDENARSAFADLAKVGVAGYIGSMMPLNRIDKSE